MRYTRPESPSRTSTPQSTVSPRVTCYANTIPVREGLPTNRELIGLARLACGEPAATKPQLLACYFCHCPAGAGVP